ncbi:hypothetical protein U8527_00925 [Kordia algicida OT-1]|uniref:Pectate lyase superfamily protein domain-containing protein n=1 Tax=Kordia algicida OT-1 TaxID=391587 RepID=A9DRY0_9FLAO|nr:hypothetical protein [Kordia algicida]EDP96858.1 hypothetical protein KAOT1_16883 [Kordia algicida OT-1]
MNVVESFEELYNYASPSDKEMVYMRGYLNDEDGGGGFFIFDAKSSLEPFYQSNTPNARNPKSPYASFEAMLKIGYNANYDGMVCKSKTNPNGKWTRQWDRGKLNLRWFGARPSGSDASPAVNAALQYAQFDIAIRQRDGKGKYVNPPKFNPPIHTFNNRAYTRPGKTIFIPSGRYYFHTFISTIYYGVVFEGEGNMGTSAHGTRLLIFHRYNDFNFANPNNPKESILPQNNDKGAFFRYVANGSNNAGGGLKNLTVDVPLLFIPEEEKNNPKYINAYDANIVSLLSTETSCVDKNGYKTDCPAVAKWTAENIVFTLNARAKRAIFMESCQKGSGLRWRIRDTTLINCWFAGASIHGETVFAKQSSGLHVIGGFFASGLGAVNRKDRNLPPERVKPGIFLDDCANTHLTGVDLTHGEIYIHKKSRFINIACRFGKLLIYDGPEKEHIDLQVSKRYVLNPRKLPDYLDRKNAPSGYICFNNAQEIEDDATWLHNSLNS